MGHVSIRDLRNHGGEIVDRAEHGELITITRSGKPVLELRALPAPALTAEVLLARWRHLPQIDVARLHSDSDALIDPGL
ncbi:MAG: type II toxin-antitoxin system prevent-host-death family antitoxin [Thermoleophilia bacterium]